MENEQLILPEVGGRRVNRSNADMERAFLVCLAREQEKGDFADSALVAALCDGVRIVREYSDVMNAR